MNQILANLQNTFEDDEPEVVVRFPPRAGAHHDVTTHPQVELEAPTTMLQSRSASHFNMASRAPDVTVDELPPPLPPLMGTYPISNATYGSHNMLMEEPYLPPPPIQAPPPKPAVTSRVPRFTEYLQNESLPVFFAELRGVLPVGF